MADLRTDLRMMPAADECLSFADFLQHFRLGMDRVMTRPSRALGCSPQEAFERDTTPLERIDPRLLALTLLRRGETRLVRKEGIELRDRLYVAPELADFVGYTVEVGWKGRAEDGPNELAVFLLDDRGRRLKRALRSERSTGPETHDHAIAADDEVEPARRASGPLIDASGGGAFEDFLCLATRSDLVGPDLIARVTHIRDRQVQTVRDAELAAQEQRLKLLPEPPDGTQKRRSKATRSKRSTSKRRAHRRAFVDRTRKRREVGS